MLSKKKKSTIIIILKKKKTKPFHIFTNMSKEHIEGIHALIEGELFSEAEKDRINAWAREMNKFHPPVADKIEASVIITDAKPMPQKKLPAKKIANHDIFSFMQSVPYIPFLTENDERAKTEPCLQAFLPHIYNPVVAVQRDAEHTHIAREHGLYTKRLIVKQLLRMEPTATARELFWRINDPVTDYSQYPSTVEECRLALRKYLKYNEPNSKKHVARCEAYIAYIRPTPQTTVEVLQEADIWPQLDYDTLVTGLKHSAMTSTERHNYANHIIATTMQRCRYVAQHAYPDSNPTRTQKSLANHIVYVAIVQSALQYKKYDVLRILMMTEPQARAVELLLRANTAHPHMVLDARKDNEQLLIDKVNLIINYCDNRHQRNVQRDPAVRQRRFDHLTDVFNIEIMKHEPGVFANMERYVLRFYGEFLRDFMSVVCDNIHTPVQEPMAVPHNTQITEANIGALLERCIQALAERSERPLRPLLSAVLGAPWMYTRRNEARYQSIYSRFLARTHGRNLARDASEQDLRCSAKVPSDTPFTDLVLRAVVASDSRDTQIGLVNDNDQWILQPISAARPWNARPTAILADANLRVADGHITVDVTLQRGAHTNGQYRFAVGRPGHTWKCSAMLQVQLVGLPTLPQHTVTHQTPPQHMAYICDGDKPSTAAARDVRHTAAFAHVPGPIQSTQSSADVKALHDVIETNTSRLWNDANPVEIAILPLIRQVNDIDSDDIDQLLQGIARAMDYRPRLTATQLQRKNKLMELLFRYQIMIHAHRVRRSIQRQRIADGDTQTSRELLKNNPSLQQYMANAKSLEEKWSMDRIIIAINSVAKKYKFIETNPGMRFYPQPYLHIAMKNMANTMTVFSKEVLRDAWFQANHNYGARDLRERFENMVDIVATLSHYDTTNFVEPDYTEVVKPYVKAIEQLMLVGDYVGYADDGRLQLVFKSLSKYQRENVAKKSIGKKKK